MKKRLHTSKFMSIVLSCMMVFSMFAGTGTMPVQAATYSTGTINDTELKAGDVIYRGVTLSTDRQIVVCRECKMIWITKGTNYSSGDQKNSAVKKMAPHNEHTGSVGYSHFSFYFTEANGELPKNTPYTIAENANYENLISYDTDGGNSISSERGNTLPNPLPTPTKSGYDFVGWYTDKGLTNQAKPGNKITDDTILYAKWVEHQHTFSNTWKNDETSHWHETTCGHSEKGSLANHIYGSVKGTSYYTCTVCNYVNKTRKADVEAANVVDAKITAIGTVEYTESCKAKIEEAETVYDDLTETQKNLVNNYGKLTEARKKYDDLEAKDKADKEAAAKVIDKINAIGKVEYTPESKEKIEAAREAYDKLTANQKAKITKEQYKVLTDAEAEYARLSEAAKKDDTTKKDNTNQAVTSSIAFEKGFKVIQTGNKIKISWDKVKKADGYIVYVSYCGDKFAKPVKTIKNPNNVSMTITKLNGKKLSAEKNVKVYVKAYQVVNGKKIIIGKSIVAHIAGRKNKTNTNAKAIKLTSKNKVTLAKGKTSQIKAKTVLKDSSKKEFPEKHVAKFRYVSSNKKVATVNKNGKIKAKAKGSCSIYVYAKNGIAKEIKVIVNN